MNNRPDDGGDDDSEGGEALPQAPLSKLGHQETKEMIERLLRHAMQNNFPEDNTQGLQKYAKELERRNLNKVAPSAHSKFFRSKGASASKVTGNL